MANDVKVITGAIAIIKVKGFAVGKMRDVRVTENFQRIPVPKGLGSIFDDELALVKWSGSCSCSFMEVSYKASGIKDAVRRVFGANILSQIASGNNIANFEDQAVLDDLGVDLEIYKKIADIIDPATGLIIPKAIPYSSLGGLFIESDSVNISEANVAGRDQTFRYLRPVVVSE